LSKKSEILGTPCQRIIAAARFTASSRFRAKVPAAAYTSIIGMRSVS